MPTTADITVTTDDGPMPAFEAKPDGDARGALVVVQEAFGVTSHIRDVARRAAGAGWHAVAPSLFHRQGSPVIDYDDLAAAMPVMQSLTAGGLATDLVGTLDHLDAAGHPAARCGIVGFCMGGTVAFYGATLRPLGAAITFYGGGVAKGRFGLPSLVDLAPSLRTPWLGLYGDRDQGIPVEDVEQLRQATGSAPVDTEIVRYPGAGHGFHCDDRPAAFDAGAAADGWQRTLEWLGRHIAA